MPSLFSRFLNFFKFSNKEEIPFEFERTNGTGTFRPASPIKKSEASTSTKLVQICQELVTTEESFRKAISEATISSQLHDKKLLQNPLIKPYKSLSEKQLFNEELINSIKTLSETTTNREKIEETISTICTKINDLVTNQSTKELFIAATTNYQEAEKLLKDPLRSPFIQPLQRAVRYPLLLKELLKPLAGNNITENPLTLSPAATKANIKLETVQQLFKTIQETENFAATINAAKTLSDFGCSIGKINNLLSDKTIIEVTKNITTAKTATELCTAITELHDSNIQTAIINKKPEDIFTPPKIGENQKPNPLIQKAAKLLKQDFYLSKVTGTNLKEKISTVLEKNEEINFQSIPNTGLTIAARFNGYKSRTLYVIHMLNIAYTEQNPKNIEKYLGYLGLKEQAAEIISSLQLTPTAKSPKNQGELINNQNLRNPKNTALPSPSAPDNNTKPTP